MARLRCRFYKKGDLVFISHLDLMRVFERAMRRGRIPIAYSQGFNPHPIMAFATALGVGVASEAEYMDIQLSEEISPEEFMERLNAVLPQGLRILQCEYISPSEDSLMAILRQSIYLVKVELASPISRERAEELLEAFLNQEEIIEFKEKKKKGKQFHRGPKASPQAVNIRGWIQNASVFSVEDNELILKTTLTTGSSGNLKPETFIQHFKDFSGLPIDMESIRINRLALLKEVDGQFLPILP